MLALPVMNVQVNVEDLLAYHEVFGKLQNDMAANPSNPGAVIAPPQVGAVVAAASRQGAHS